MPSRRSSPHSQPPRHPSDAGGLAAPGAGEGAYPDSKLRVRGPSRPVRGGNHRLHHQVSAGVGGGVEVFLPRRECRESFLPLPNVLAVLRSKPPTPPSHSAARGERDRASYLQQLKDTFTCVPYLLLLLALGCGVALFSALATVAQQILCPLGYDDVSDNCSAPASWPHFLLGLGRCVVSLFLLHPPTH